VAVDRHFPALEALHGEIAGASLDVRRRERDHAVRHLDPLDPRVRER
jgi:hypothetical protein